VTHLERERVILILTAATAMTALLIPAEGAVEPAAQQPREGAFGHAVEKAIAKAGARSGHPKAHGGKGAAGAVQDPAAGAWAAQLTLQPVRFALVQPASPNAAAFEGAGCHAAASQSAAEEVSPIAAGAAVLQGTATGALPRSMEGLNTVAIQDAALPRSAEGLDAAGFKGVVGGVLPRSAEGLNAAAPKGAAAEASPAAAWAAVPKDATVEVLPRNAEGQNAVIPKGATVEALPRSATAQNAVALQDAAIPRSAEGLNAASFKRVSMALPRSMEGLNAAASTGVTSKASPMAIGAAVPKGAAVEVLPRSAEGLNAAGLKDASMALPRSAKDLNMATIQDAALPRSMAAQSAAAPLKAVAPQGAVVQAESTSGGTPPHAADIAEAILTNRAASLAGGAAAAIVADVAGTILANQAAALEIETAPAGAEDAVATALANRAAARTGGGSLAAAIVQAASGRPFTAEPQPVKGAAIMQAVSGRSLAAEPQPVKGAVLVNAKAAPEFLPVNADARQEGAPGIPAAADAEAEAGTRMAEAGLAEQAQDAVVGPRAKAVGAQPRAAAAQPVPVQPTALRQVSGKGQAAGAEPEGGRGEAPKRPAEERQAAPAVAAFRQVTAEPRAEQATAAARTDAPRSASEPDAAAQLARASLGALARGDREYRLKLRPEGVGEVAVTIGAQGRELRLTIRASQESTRELILDQIGTLKQQLEDSGYHLDGFSVDVSGGNGGPGFQQNPERQPEAHRSARPEAAPQPQPKEPARAAPKVWQGAINYRI